MSDSNDIKETTTSATPSVDAPEFLEIMAQVTSYFKGKWKLDEDSYNDLYQDLYLAFKERQMEQVIKYYRPEAGQFEDYFRRAAYNKCRELLRSKNIRQKKEEPLDLEDIFHGSDAADPEKQIIAEDIIKRECYKIDMFIQLLSKHKSRLELLLKLYSRIILKKTDLIAYYRQIARSLMRSALLVFGTSYADLQDQDVMQGIFPVVQAKEPEVQQVNSLRRWLDRQINRLTDHMNQLGDYQYEHASLRNALLIYFQK